jgi:Flp pilus assembly protein TadB
MLFGGVVLVAGIVVSLPAASIWRAEQMRRGREKFRSSAAAATSALSTLLLRDADFVDPYRPTGSNRSASQAALGRSPFTPAFQLL